MSVKKVLSIFIAIILLMALSTNIVPYAMTSDVVDGTITVEDGEVTLSGPVGIENQEDAMEHVIDKYKNIIVFVGGMLTVTSVGVFIVYFIKLGTISSNPRERKEVITGLLIAGLSATFMGSATLIVGLFYGLFRDGGATP